MTLHQDTDQFTQSERDLMADALRKQAGAINDELLRHNKINRKAMDPETRIMRINEAATLRSLAEDIEWGNRR